MKTAIHIGTDVEKVTPLVKELEPALIAILNTSAGDEVKIAAIQALQTLYPAPTNVSLSNMHIQNTPESIPLSQDNQIEFDDSEEE